MNLLRTSLVLTLIALSTLVVRDDRKASQLAALEQFTVELQADQIGMQNDIETYREFLLNLRAAYMKKAEELDKLKVDLEPLLNSRVTALHDYLDGFYIDVVPQDLPGLGLALDWQTNTECAAIHGSEGCPGYPNPVNLELDEELESPVE